jgi:hypothetical protein
MINSEMEVGRFKHIILSALSLNRHSEGLTAKEPMLQKFGQLSFGSRPFYTKHDLCGQTMLYIDPAMFTS